jgi:hypothetical protein
VHFLVQVALANYKTPNEISKAAILAFEKPQYDLRSRHLDTVSTVTTMFYRLLFSFS